MGTFEAMRHKLSCPDCERFEESPWNCKQGVCVMTDYPKFADGRRREIVTEVTFVDDEFTVAEMDCQHFEPTFTAIKDWELE